MERRLWQDLTWAEVAALDPATVAVLPVAAVEQHGAHLPLVVDACINEALVARAVAEAPAALPFVVLPMQAVGWSEEHLAFPGTLSLSADTLLAVLRDLGACVRRAGLRRLVLLNSHGGQPQVLEIVARELRVRFGMFVVVAGWTKLGVPEGLFASEERAHGIHGGALETSLMLHLRPDLVRLELLADNASAAAGDGGRFLSATGRVPYAWAAQDLHSSGACGDALAASAEKGRVLAEHLVAGFVEMLEEVARFPLERVAAGPGSSD